MSLKISEINTAMAKWIQVNSPKGTIVARAQQNVQRPRFTKGKKQGQLLEPYITFQKLTQPKIGQADLVHKSGGTFKIITAHSLGYSIKVHALDAEQIASDLVASLEKPTVLAILRESSLAHWNEPSIINMTQELQTGLETRFGFDVTFGIGQEIEDDIGFIDKTEATGTYKGTEGDITVSLDINQ